MKKIGKNLDIIYEQSKNKIVVNIYSDIKDVETIYHQKEKNYTNNNDTLNFISSVFSFLESAIFNLHNYFIYYFPSVLIKLYRYQYMLLITTLLFSFGCGLRNNSNISTNLIISAYFPKATNLVYFKANNLKNIPKKNDKEKNNQRQQQKTINNKINEKNLDEKINHMNEDMKNIIHISGYKSTYISYENKECIEVKENNSLKNEIYLFFIIPIKSFTFSIISISSLILFIKTEILSKLCHLFIFNLACIFAVDNAIKYLYENSYFLASSFMLLLLLYLFKNLIDSIYILLKFRREDFEIFSSDLMAKNQRQFILKFVILNLLVIVATYFSFVLYKLALNYIIFYLCVLTLISFLFNCLEIYSPQDLKPLKNILMFSCGLINLTISKLVNSSYFDNTIFYLNSNEEMNENEENDDFGNMSFFFVSDLFSFFCFDYLNEFISQFRNNFHFHKILVKLDYIMIFFFMCSISLCFLSIVEKQINCFLLAIFACKLLIHYFIEIFKIKYVRIISNVIYLLFIFTHLFFSINMDEVFSKFVPFNKLKMKIVQDLFDLLIILMVTYFEFNMYFHLYFSEKSINNDELKELPDSQVNKILEFTHDKSLKNLKIQIIHDNFSKFRIENVFLNFCNIIMNYFNISTTVLIYQKYNANILIIILYISLIFLFLSSKYFVLNNIKNVKEYSHIFFISFYLSLRQITIPFSKSKILYIIFEISTLILIISYSINTHRNTFMDIIIIIYLLCNYAKINKFFVTVDISFLFVSPKIKEYLTEFKNKLFIKNEDSIEENEFKNRLTIVSFVAIFVMLLIQIYIYQNLELVLKMIHIISKKMEFDDESYYYYETTYVYYIINKINYFFKLNIFE